MTKIYVLERSGVPFYIGKANDTIRRKHKHYQTYSTDITLSVIDEVEDWKYWEEHWIEQFKAWGFNLLNQNKGGGGPERYTEEQKQKMRKPRPGSGIKIGKTLKQRNHSKYYTEEVRQRISEGNKILKPFSDEHKQNMGIAKRKQAIPVLMFDLNDNLIREWESKGQAAEWIKETTGKTSNITSQIKDCILGRQKTAFKFKWKYK
jgi:hypothetical protein